MPLTRNLNRLIHRARLWQGILYPTLVLILYLATTSDPSPMPAASNDKVNHILAFLCLGILFHWGFPRAGWYRAVVLLLGYGLMIEVLQSFLPYRDFSLLDLVADLAGIGIGFFLGQVLRRRQPQ